MNTLPTVLALVIAVYTASVGAGTLSHAEALARIRAAGMDTNGKCTSRHSFHCTSLDGIHTEAIDEIITLKRASGCPIVVTGGTETGHGHNSGRSHANGWKLDIRLNSCVSGYITSTFRRMGASSSRWRAPSGNIYLREKDHWDIQYNTGSRFARTVEEEGDDEPRFPQEPDALTAPNTLDETRVERSDVQSDGEYTNHQLQEEHIEEVIPEEDAERDQPQSFNSSVQQEVYRYKRSDVDRCFSCICTVESNCRNLACAWDVNSLSCGYFQIKKEYYADCYTPGRRRGESLVTAWKRCAADYSCSTQCMTNYVNRFGFKCPGVGFCQKLARLHNGGPNGCRKSATNRYWNKVYQCL